MITELPVAIRTLHVGQALLNESRDLLEPYRRQRLEGCLLWYGYVLDDETCVATTCVRPRQKNFSTSYEISAEHMRDVRRSARPLGLLLLVQVHTHPKAAYFSPWDEENALNKAPGALNMIVPDYGAASWIDAKRFCMVEKDDGGRWRPWTAEDWQKLSIVPASLAL